MFFRKSQNDQEKRGSEAIASFMRQLELDTHTKLHRKGTREDCYLTSAVSVVKDKGCCPTEESVDMPAPMSGMSTGGIEHVLLSSIYCKNLAFLDSRVLRQILSGKLRQ